MARRRKRRQSTRGSRRRSRRTSRRRLGRVRAHLVLVPDSVDRRSSPGGARDTRTARRRRRRGFGFSVRNPVSARASDVPSRPIARRSTGRASRAPTAVPGFRSSMSRGRDRRLRTRPPTPPLGRRSGSVCPSRARSSVDWLLQSSLSSAALSAPTYSSISASARYIMLRPADAGEIKDTPTSSSSSPSHPRKNTMRKSIKNLFSSAPKFQKGLKR